jgi:proteasome lid subunit RPN8/RPN11
MNEFPEPSAEVAAFAPAGRQQPGLLERPRPSENEDYIRFNGDRSDVFVRRDVLSFIRELADWAKPNEIAGVLAGRACRDSLGLYILIEKAEPATTRESLRSTGHVEITADGWRAVRERAFRKFPALDEEGWFHTHPHSVAVFSGEDHLEQSTWPGDRHVGIVVSALNGAETVGVYVGPTAERLTPASRGRRDSVSLPQERRLQTRSPLDFGPPPPRISTIPSKAIGRPAPRGSRRASVIGLLVGIGLLIVVALAVALVIAGRPSHPSDVKTPPTRSVPNLDAERPR